MSQAAKHASPRQVALALMAGVLDEGRLLSDLAATPMVTELAPGDRARAARLATETLRTLDRADRLLKPLLRKEPPLMVQNILRLGVVEICGNGEAAHGVVNDLVGIAGASNRTQPYKGMVNAVLRRAGEAGEGKWGKMPVPRLPKWLRQPLMAAYGNSAMQGIEAAHLRGAPLDLSVKPGVDAAALAEATAGVVLPTGSVRIAGTPQVSALPGFDAGDWWVQDAAAALPAQLLNAQPGEVVADFCAAPGGKTMQLAAAGAQVTAVDSHGGRLERVHENLTRVGLSAEVIEADVLRLGGSFDAILLDAPCSATGTIRRHPDLPYARDGHGISELIALQAQMIDAALAQLNPGGRMVFCTCSLLPDEGEVQVEEALARHPGVTTDRAVLERPGIDPAWITEEGGLRLRPDYWSEQGGMDGFYMALLHKPA